MSPADERNAAGVATRTAIRDRSIRSNRAGVVDTIAGPSALTATNAMAHQGKSCAPERSLPSRYLHRRQLQIMHRIFAARIGHAIARRCTHRRTHAEQTRPTRSRKAHHVASSATPTRQRARITTRGSSTRRSRRGSRHARDHACAGSFAGAALSPSITRAGALVGPRVHIARFAQISSITASTTRCANPFHRAETLDLRGPPDDTGVDSRSRLLTGVEA